MNKILLSLVILLSVLAVMFALAFSFYLLDSKTTKTIELEKKDIFVKTGLGCLRIKDKMTVAEFQTQQDLSEALTGRRLIRCE